jgi:methylenetetrahydrofolate dehydrogenase (NADP+) / methenyltetrahydrofolate cyclohydrolase
MTIILDGKLTSQKILEEIKNEIALKKITPTLAVVLVGDDPASETYVKNKTIASQKVGIVSNLYKLPTETSENDLLSLIDKLNKDPKTNGILVQLPLPAHINKQKVIESIAPQKDVDCFHPLNIGKLYAGTPGPRPCTPAGILALLDNYELDIASQLAVVVGRSNIVGKPVAQMLLDRDATVVIAHSKTKDLDSLTRQADILIAALGSLRFIKKDMVKDGAIVVDVGMNRDKAGRLAGDVDFESLKEKCQAITPVPGGVGPMTIAMLMKNCLDLYYEQNK